MKLIKIIILCIFVINLGSCATKLVEKANESKQQEIKQTVLELLQKEYSQPFKVISSSYEYKNSTSPQNDCVFLYCKTTKIGVYSFKIQAIDNPIIVMDISISEYKDNMSLKELLDSFKKNELKTIYCVSFGGYYNNNYHAMKKVTQPYTKRAEEFCNARKQPFYERYKKKYLEKIA